MNNYRMDDDEVHRKFTEKYDVGNFIASFLQFAQRSANLQLMIDCLKKALDSSTPAAKTSQSNSSRNKKKNVQTRI